MSKFRNIYRMVFSLDVGCCPNHLPDDANACPKARYQMSAHAIVKARTAAAHRIVDVAYSSFELADRDSYSSFLRAHARVLPAIEALLGHGPNLPPWRPRTALLSRDLDALGNRPPNPQVLSETTGLSEKFGLLYVLEGSRLGGRLLWRRVGLGFPSHYLSSAHAPGEWRAFIQALDDRARAAGADWIEGVVAGANCGFHLYELSAADAFAERATRPDVFPKEFVRRSST